MTTIEFEQQQDLSLSIGAGLGVLEEEPSLQEALRRRVRRDVLRKASQNPVVQRDPARQETVRSEVATSGADDPERGHYIPLQKWDGIVLSVDAERNTFVTRLLDRSKRVEPIEAEISFEEIQPADHELLRPGAAFYWNIAFRTERNGRRVRESWIRFRRLGAPAATVVEEGKREAEEIRSLFGWQ
jgi:hypothetical protein